MDTKEQIQIIKMLALIEGLYDYTNQVDQTNLEKKFKDRVHLYSFDETAHSTLFPYFQITYLT
jgi:hypothetical protein